MDAQSDDGDDAADPEAQPGHVDERVGEDAAEADLLGVREVGETGRAVDQRQPDRGEREEQPEPQPVERALDEEVGLAGGRVERPGADLEQRHEGLLLHVRADLDVDGLLGPAAGGDVLGQRLLVEGHLVRRRPLCAW